MAGYTFGDIGGCNCCTCFGCGGDAPGSTVQFPLTSFSVGWAGSTGGTGSGTISYLGAGQRVTWAGGTTQSRLGCCWQGSFNVNLHGAISNWTLQLVCNPGCTALSWYNNTAGAGDYYLSTAGCDAPNGANPMSLGSTTCSPLSIAVVCSTGTLQGTLTIT